MHNCHHARPLHKFFTKHTEHKLNVTHLCCQSVNLSICILLCNCFLLLLSHDNQFMLPLCPNINSPFRFFVSSEKLKCKSIFSGSMSLVQTCTWLFWLLALVCPPCFCPVILFSKHPCCLFCHHLSSKRCSAKLYASAEFSDAYKH